MSPGFLSPSGVRRQQNSAKSRRHESRKTKELCAAAFTSVATFTCIAVNLLSCSVLCPPSTPHLRQRNLVDFYTKEFANEAQLYHQQTQIGPTIPIVPLNVPTGSFANCSATRRFMDATAITVACRTFRYKVPKTALQSLQEQRNLDANGTTRLLVGVLSVDPIRREGIRSTWANDLPRHSVYFLLAGDWTPEIEKEQGIHNDLIWFDYTDNYWDLMYKVQGFVTLMQGYAANYFTHLLKADDDSFVNVPLLMSALGSADLVGHIRNSIAPSRTAGTKFYLSLDEYPEPKFPPYCCGAGYAISRQFAQCIAQETSIVRYLKIEDIATGLLAQRCNASIGSVNGMIIVHKDPWRIRGPRVQKTMVQHEIRTKDEMQSLYAKLP